MASKPLAPAPRPRSRTTPRPHRVRRSWARQQPALATLLAPLPSLPRPVLARLAARMIDRLDDIDGDADMEDAREDDEDGHDRELACD